MLRTAALLGAMAASANAVFLGIPQTPVGGPFLCSPVSCEGNAKDIRLLGAAPLRGQVVYSQASGTLTGLLSGDVITGLSLRTDAEETRTLPNDNLNFTNFNIVLANASVLPTGMSTTFANNYGAGGPFLVRSGAFSVVADSYPISPDTFSPHGWGPNISFQAPFVYTGGNLLVELAHTGHGELSGLNNPKLDFHGGGAVLQNFFRIAVDASFAGATGAFENGASSYQAPLLNLEFCRNTAFSCADASGSVTINCFGTEGDAAGSINGTPVVIASPASFSQMVSACLPSSGFFARCGVQNPYNLLTCGSSANGDPHLVGFNGAKFDFMGEGDSVFNMISDVDYQLNTLFENLIVGGVNGTWISEIGVSTPNYRIGYSPAEGVIVNEGVVVRPGQTKSFGEEVSVEVNANSATIATSRYVVAASVMKSKQDTYLNLAISIVRPPIDPHGVLGQTARYVVDDVSKDQPIEGSDMDYRVNDGIFGSDFTYNKFNTNAARSVHVRSVENFSTVAAAFN